MTEIGGWIIDDKERPEFMICVECRSVFRMQSGESSYNFCPHCGQIKSEKLAIRYITPDEAKEKTKKEIGRFIGYLDEDMIYRLGIAIDRLWKRADTASTPYSINHHFIE